MSLLNFIYNKIQQTISKNVISLIQIYLIHQEVWSTFFNFNSFDNFNVSLLMINSKFLKLISQQFLHKNINSLFSFSFNKQFPLLS